MTSFDDTFSGFIDHYILLLAARFKAPIHTWSGRTKSGLIDDPASAAWTLVSRCVQEVMNSSSTQTTSERQQLKHVDVALFTPQVCRERAMYLQWRIQKDEQARRSAKKAKKGGDNAGKKKESTGPSSFDVTKDSLSNDVMSLFDAVRRNLPSAILEAHSSDDDDDDDDDDDEDLEIVDVDLARKRAAASAKKGGEVSAFYLQADTIVNVPMRSDEQVKQDRDMAKARDAMLTKVQEMQTDFFNKYRRWVDVPEDLMDAPPVMMGRPGEDQREPRPAMPSTMGSGGGGARAHTSASASMGRTQNVETPTTPPSGSSAAGNMPSDASEMLQELKRRIHVGRPNRPSTMSDEGIEAMYANSAPPPMDVHLPGGPFSFAGGATSAATSRPPMDHHHHPVIDHPPPTSTSHTLPKQPSTPSSPSSSPAGPSSVGGGSAPQTFRGAPAVGGGRFGGAAPPHPTPSSTNVHKVTKETAAPTVAGRRAGRLQVLEYDD